MMEKPGWYKLCEDSILQKYFREISKSFAPKNPRVQHTLFAKALIWVAKYGEGKTVEYCMHRGFMEMNKYYQEELKHPGYKPRNLANDRAIQRVTRKAKRFFRKMKLKVGV